MNMRSRRFSLEAFWKHSGSILEAFWKHFGSILEATESKIRRNAASISVERVLKMSDESTSYEELAQYGDVQRNTSQPSLNQRVQGSSPCAATKLFKGLARNGRAFCLLRRLPGAAAFSLPKAAEIGDDDRHVLPPTRS